MKQSYKRILSLLLSVVMLASMTTITLLSVSAETTEIVLDDCSDKSRWSSADCIDGANPINIWWPLVTRCQFANPVDGTNMTSVKIDFTGSGNQDNTFESLFTRDTGSEFDSSAFGIALTSMTGDLPTGDFKLTEEAWTTYGVRVKDADILKDIVAGMNTFAIDWTTAGASFDRTAITGIAIVARPGTQDSYISVVKGVFEENNSDNTETVVINNCDSLENWDCYPGDGIELDTDVKTEGTGSIKTYQDGGFAACYDMPETMDFSNAVSVTFDFIANTDRALSETAEGKSGIVIASEGAPAGYCEAYDETLSNYGVWVDEASYKAQEPPANTWKTITVNIDWSRAGENFDSTKVKYIKFFGQGHPGNGHEQRIDNVRVNFEKGIGKDQDVQSVEDTITGLPTEVTVDDYDKIAAARKAYNALTDAQKKLVDNLDKLEAAEEAYKNIVIDSKEITITKCEVTDGWSATGSLTFTTSNVGAPQGENYIFANGGAGELTYTFNKAIDFTDIASFKMWIYDDGGNSYANSIVKFNSAEGSAVVDISSPLVVAWQEIENNINYENTEGNFDITNVISMTISAAPEAGHNIAIDDIRVYTAATTQGAVDAAAAKIVEDKIAALEPVADVEKATVEAVRKEYDKLTNAQKDLVSNLAILEAAEEALKPQPVDAFVISNCDSTDGWSPWTGDGMELDTEKKNEGEASIHFSQKGGVGMYYAFSEPTNFNGITYIEFDFIPAAADMFEKAQSIKVVLSSLDSNNTSSANWGNSALIFDVEYIHEIPLVAGEWNHIRIPFNIAYSTEGFDVTSVKKMALEFANYYGDDVNATNHEWLDNVVATTDALPELEGKAVIMHDCDRATEDVNNFIGNAATTENGALVVDAQASNGFLGATDVMYNRVGAEYGSTDYVTSYNYNRYYQFEMLVNPDKDQKLFISHGNDANQLEWQFRSEADVTANRWQRVEIRTADITESWQGDPTYGLDNVALIHIAQSNPGITKFDNFALVDLAYKNRRAAAETAFFEAVGAIGTVNENSAGAIAAAKEAKAALEEFINIGTRENLNAMEVLAQKEAEFILLDKPEVKAVYDLIEALNKEITVDDEAEIVAARNAFEALDDADKELISNYAILDKAESDLILAKKEAEIQRKAQEVRDTVNALNDIETLNEENIEKFKADTDAAEEALNNLDDEVKATMTDLADLEAVLSGAKKKIEDYEKLQVVYGDLNGDGEVTTADALIALQASVKKVELTAKQQKAADVNGEEGITTDDALKILQKAVKKIDLFPVEQ